MVILFFFILGNLVVFILILLAIGEIRAAYFLCVMYVGGHPL